VAWKLTDELKEMKSGIEALMETNEFARNNQEYFNLFMK
jgi:hypothetical protein